MQVSEMKKDELFSRRLDFRMQCHARETNNVQLAIITIKKSSAVEWENTLQDRLDVLTHKRCLLSLNHH